MWFTGLQSPTTLNAIKEQFSMCIYCGTSQYRKIYEHHRGPIPIDDDGRTFDIHHIDKNHNNNDPENLVALSIKDHYKIHEESGDWAACSALIRRMKFSPQDLSEKSRELQKKLVEEGTHLFLTANPGTSENLRRIANGSHNLLGDKNPIHNRILSGEHQAMVKDMNARRVAEGIHHWLGDRNPSIARIQNGSHPFKERLTCPHCQCDASKSNSLKYHFDKCKFKGMTAEQIIEAKRKLTKERRRLHRQKRQRKPTHVTCPHCNKVGAPSNMKRWHYENCPAITSAKQNQGVCIYCNIKRWHNERCKSKFKCE